MSLSSFNPFAKTDFPLNKKRKIESAEYLIRFRAWYNHTWKIQVEIFNYMPILKYLIRIH